MTIFLLIPKPEIIVDAAAGLFKLDVTEARKVAKALPDPDDADDADGAILAFYREVRDKEFLFEITLPDGTKALTTYYSDGVGDTENEWLLALVDLARGDIPNLVELLGFEIHWSAGFHGREPGKVV